MVSTSVFKLCRCDVDDSLSCTFRNKVNETEKILTGISESHSTADARFIIRSRTAHIKCYHTLILVPDVNHTVNSVIGWMNSVFGKKIIPICIKFGKCLVNVSICLIFGKESFSRLLVDYVRSFPLVINRVLYVCKNENKWLAFARIKLNVKLVACNRRPTACHWVGAGTASNGIRGVGAVIKSYKTVSCGIKSVNRCINRVNSVMITSLTVFCLVVDCRTVNLNLAGA